MNNTDIKTSQELKEFLEGLEFKQVEGLLSPIYLTSVMNYIFSLDNINSLMTDATFSLVEEAQVRCANAGMLLLRTSSASFTV